MAIEKKAKETAPAPSDKQKALETAISQIEKQFGKGAVMRLGQNATMNVEAIPTGSLSLDMALGIGGLPRGRIVEIYGPESSGKTTLALHILAEAQKKGGEAYKWLTELTQSAAYRNMSNEEKVECIDYINKGANEVAKAKVVSSYEPTKWVKEALKGGGGETAAIAKVKDK